MVVGKLWGSCFFVTGTKSHWMLQLVVCAIPVFFKLPGATDVDLGSRTEGFPMFFNPTFPHFTFYQLLLPTGGYCCLPLVRYVTSCYC